MKKFKIYKEYYDLILTISDSEKQEKVTLAMFNYGFKRKLPKLNGECLKIFNTIKEKIDKRGE